MGGLESPQNEGGYFLEYPVSLNSSFACTPIMTARSRWSITSDIVNLSTQGVSTQHHFFHLCRTVGNAFAY